MGLGLRQGEPLPFVGRIIEAQVVGIRPVRQVLERETQVQQTAAPAPAGQEIRPPLHVHLQVITVRVHHHDRQRLLVARGRVEHVFLVHEPSVEITVPRRNAGIVLGLERPLIDEFLPYPVVRGEIDVLEQLSIQHRVDGTCRFPGLYLDGPLPPGHSAYDDRNDE